MSKLLITSAILVSIFAYKPIVEMKLTLKKAVLTPCEQLCKDKAQVRMNLCQKLSSANRLTCQNNAIQAYQLCMNACN